MVAFKSHKDQNREIYKVFVGNEQKYSYLSFNFEKSQVLNCFKVFKLEVENQLNQTFKVVRSDCGGEYFGTHTEVGQQKGLFALFLQEQGIVAHCTTPGTPHQNGVADWRNMTLNDMVRKVDKTSVASSGNSMSIPVPIPCSTAEAVANNTKRDSQGRVKRLKPRLVAKGFTQREGLDHSKTFSPISTKDSFRIIMALTTHFNLELHQMYIKTAFLNSYLKEDIFKKQPPKFIERRKENF
ncbi:hypothetical protein Prudu_021392, partial [Prunus dulcis]